MFWILFFPFSLTCSWFLTFYLPDDFFAISFMWSGFSAFHFLFDLLWFSLTCSGFVLFLPNCFNIVVPLHRIWFSLFLKSALALFLCILSCNLDQLCAFHVYQLFFFQLYFDHTFCRSVPDSSLFYCRNIMSFTHSQKFHTVSGLNGRRVNFGIQDGGQTKAFWRLLLEPKCSQFSRFYGKSMEEKKRTWPLL